MSSEAKDFDIAIVGGGTIGLSAAYYAAAAGYRTVLFEQYDFYNDKGSSDGYSRMFRIMYSDANMARLAESSYGLWHEIADASGEELLDRNGLLFYGLPATTVEGDLEECAKVMTSLGVPYDRYEREALLKHYPVFRELPPKYFGLSQPSSATIEVQKSLHTFHKMAQQKGATLLSRCPAQIKPARPGASSYEIDTPHGTYTAKHMILAPGSWSNHVLASFNMKLKLKIWQMTVAYFGVDPKLAWPMWYEFGPEVNGQQQLFYGFPPLEQPDKIKVSADYSNDIYDDPRECSYKPDPRILEAISKFVAQRFKEIDPTPRDPATCLYTMSADSQIILDCLPGFPNVSVLTGESGRAFKYTPLFGRILVELATTGKSAYDISEFSINRGGLFA
jgi:monomeric sarcosine oxidase